MNEIGFALIGIAVGAVVGAAVAVWRRTAGSTAPDVGRLEARLEVQAAELRRLADAAAVRDDLGGQFRGELAAARRALEELSVRDQERRTVEVEAREVIRRLAGVLAGGAAAGRSGENVLRERLAELPPGMLETDFRVNGKVVEFGLLLPDGRRLPVDSKWPATTELAALEAAEDPEEREALAREVERVVALRAREAAQYLDPALTAPVAVAAVPDAAYGVLRRAHADAFAKGVVIVPYSTALPVLLFLYSLVHRYGDTGDVQASLAEVGTALAAMEEVLENRIARAATMLGNGANELRSQIGKARGSVARARGGDSEGGGPPEEALSLVR